MTRRNDNAELPFLHVVKVYHHALQSIELTQCRRADTQLKQQILKRNRNLKRLGFELEIDIFT